jgi:2-haloacid dehalogenase
MNIVFDIGNVLLHWDPRVLYRKIFDSEAEVEWFLGNVCTSEWNLEQDRGRSFEDAIAEAKARHPDHGEAIEAYHPRGTRCRPCHRGHGRYSERSAKQARLYAITNWHQDKSKRRFAPVPRAFRDIVASAMRS